MRASAEQPLSGQSAVRPICVEAPDAVLTGLRRAKPQRAARLPTRFACVVFLICFWGAVHAQPSTDQILAEMGFSAAEQRRVMGGEFVATKIDRVSERDLTYAVAFLVKSSPDALSEQVLDGMHVTDDAQVQAYGELSGPGTVSDFSALQITEDEAHALSRVEPGGATNFSTAECALFKELRGQPTQTVLEQLQRTLLTRYQTYQNSGLAGIAPYARGRSAAADVASDLTKAVQSMVALHEHLPNLYAVLLDYPRAQVPGIRQSFRWVKSIIRDKTTYVLDHVLVASDDGALAVVRRTFYVSTGYNAEQSVAGLVPVTEGTVVLYMTHAFTDQVAGSGGAFKRSIGSLVMADRMRQIFETARKRIER